MHLQASVEKSLAAHLRPAMTKPLQDGFRSSFQQHVLPAFEAACRTMFTQVGVFLVSKKPRFEHMT